MRRSFLIAVALGVAGCSGSVERNDRPTFSVDRTQPFRLEFGRGSGWNGLDTVKLDETGRVVLHRLDSEARAGATVPAWQVASMQLSADAVDEVLGSVQANDLMRLHRAYHEDVLDGTQWLLWVRQGDREKAVYFDNNFPWAIKQFAEDLDAILARAGSDTVTWQRVPDRMARKHERELWDSIKR
jgi:hypothetical protein